MPRLSDEERQIRFRKLAILWSRQAEGVLSEDQIAEELDFRDSTGAPSARVMYETLQEEWDLPNGW